MTRDVECLVLPTEYTKVVLELRVGFRGDVSKR